MNQSIQSHLMEIAKCDIFSNSCNIPCKKIVQSQSDDINFKNSYQLPEPWNGNLEQARILFISSNPSISFSEYYPTISFPDAKIEDFFTNRFSENCQYVKKHLYPLQNDNSYSKQWVRYWAAIKKLAGRILDIKDVQPGYHYAITEIVRCKSKNEIGVAEALATCSERFLLNTIKLCNAKLLVLVGAKATYGFERAFQITVPRSSCLMFFDGAAEKLVISVPHPNSRKKKIARFAF